MQDIKQRELKIQEKRKTTLFRDFVKEICSRMPTNIYKQEVGLSRFPLLERASTLLTPEDFNAHGVNTMYTDDIDLDKGFFDTLGALYKHHPKSSLNKARENENSKYADSLFGVKNAYLSFAIGDDAENILYSFTSYAQVRNVLNSVFVIGNCENIFFCTDVTESFSVFYSRFIIHSNAIRFSTNMTGCSECIDCNGLQNMSYCIGNVQFSKEVYLEEKEKILKQKELFMEKYCASTSVLGEDMGSSNVSGERIIFSENIEAGKLVSRVKNGRNLFLIAGVNSCTNFYDCFEAGFDSHDIYAVSQAGTYSQQIYCSNFIDGGSNVYYSFSLEQCSYCLGCIGLQNKSFCIFNRQYTKEERFELANRIFAQMEADGTLGTFFPGWMNPFYFNDTAAYLIDDSFTKEKVMKQGYLWREEEIKVDVPPGAEMITREELEKYQGFDKDGQRKINPEILKKVIKDEKGNYYRIVPMELEFLQKYELPLPELHRLERIKLGFKFT